LISSAKDPETVPSRCTKINSPAQCYLLSCTNFVFFLQNKIKLYESNLSIVLFGIEHEPLFLRENITWKCMKTKWSIHMQRIENVVQRDIFLIFIFVQGHEVALVEALCYKPEGRGFDSRCH
jgi:hypothetical protein